MRYSMDGSGAVERLDLAVGDRVQLDGDADQWWTVQAVSPHYVACTRPPSQSERDEYIDEWGEELEGPTYTVLDWRNGVRGPCDLIGQGWGDGTYGPDECTRMLAAFEVTDEEIQGALNMAPGGGTYVPVSVQVSQRNWTQLAVRDHQSAAAVPAN